MERRERVLREVEEKMQFLWLNVRNRSIGKVPKCLLLDISAYF